MIKENKKTDYDYISNEIAKQIAIDGLISVQDISRRVKFILKNVYFDNTIENKIEYLVKKQERQTVSLNKKDIELTLYKNELKKCVGAGIFERIKNKIDIKLINKGIK